MSLPTSQRTNASQLQKRTHTHTNGVHRDAAHEAFTRAFMKNIRRCTYGVKQRRISIITIVAVKQ